MTERLVKAKLLSQISKSHLDEIGELFDEQNYCCATTKDNKV